MIPTLLFIVLAAPLFAAKVPASASLISELKGFTPGQAITVAIRIEADSGWHTYWKDPGDAGLPTSVDLSLPPGITASALLWPKPQVFKDPSGIVGYGYMGEAILPMEIRVPASYSSDSLKIGAKVSFLVCKDICIPGSADLSLNLPRGIGLSSDAPGIAKVRSSLGQDPPDYHPLSAPEGSALPQPSPSPKEKGIGRPQAEFLASSGAGSQGTPNPPTPGPSASLSWMLLLAFLGGLILNLMPCVLPVLSLKVLNFVRQGAESPARRLLLSSAFSFGILVSFWILALLIMLGRNAGNSFGWGFQFQSPSFVISMAILVTLFALNLFGVFEFVLPGAAGQVLGQAQHREGPMGAFLMGVFMTVLATPCTAPFLGTALGFAFSQDNLSLLLIFTAAALGLALPYQVLSSFPKLLVFLPKPGVWMEHFRNLMAFPLLGTLCWLLWVLGKETSLESAIWTLAFLIALALLCWIYGTFLSQARGAKAAALLILELLLLLGAYQVFLRKALNASAAPQTAPEALSGAWIPYDAGRIAELNKEGKSVFVDFTAEWCWTCKVNERVALENEDVKAAFEKSGLVLMKADWTRADPAVTAALKAFGRSGVPFYAFYSPKLSEPLTLAEVLRPSDVLNAIQKLEASNITH